MVCCGLTASLCSELPLLLAHSGASPQRQEVLQARGCLEVAAPSWEMQSALLLDSTFPDFSFLYTYLQRGLCAGQLPICSSSALLLYLWSALPVKVQVEGWRGGGRSKLSSASYGISSTGGPGPPGSALECDHDSGGLSSCLLPLFL